MAGVSHDTLIHRLVRPVVRPLSFTPVTPNQITSLRLGVGLAAAAGLAMPGGWRAAGAGLYLLSLLMDRMDGELARLTGLTSTGGYRYDLICDCVATVAAFAGLGIGLREALGPLAMALGVVAGVSVVGLFYHMNVAKLASPAGLGAHGRTWIDPDDAMFALPVLIWTGQAKLALMAAGVLTPIVLIVLVLLSRLKPRVVPTA